MRYRGRLIITKPSKRDWCFVCLACFYAVWCLVIPRYKTTGGMMNGPIMHTMSGGLRPAWVSEQRMDRWTGLEEQRGTGVLDNDPNWHRVSWLGVRLP